jgi:hypothetical protein
MVDPALLNEGLNLRYVLAGYVNAKASVKVMEAAVNHIFLEDNPNEDLEIP